MSIGARLTAWWSAWQVVFWLVVVIALLAALNVWQWKRAITADSRAEAAGWKQAMEDTQAIAADKDKSAERLEAAARAAAKQLYGASKAYGKAMADNPLTPDNCAPGQARVDATNLALGSSASPGEE